MSEKQKVVIIRVYGVDDSDLSAYVVEASDALCELRDVGPIAFEVVEEDVPE